MTETGHTSKNSAHQSADGRSQFIPVLKTDIVTTLTHSGLTPDQQGDFETLCSFLGSYFHHDFFDELTELKDIYAWFSPAGPRPAKREPPDGGDAYRRLTETFDSVLKRANFTEVSRADVEALGGEHPLLDVKTRTPMQAYESIRIFYRGRHAEKVAHAGALGVGKIEIPVEVFDDVVVFVRFKQTLSAKRGRLALRRGTGLPGDAQPGSVLIKSFRNISRFELPMLMPDVQVVMSRKDAVLLGGPALLGAVPIALNILPALSVVLVVAGAYLGFSGAPTQEKLVKAVAALSVLVGAGAFMFRQYSNYAFRKLKYQKRLADNIYFKNINNDAGVFETLIGSAEDQEVKEVLLAYHALLTGGPAANEAELDTRIEAWLKANFAVDLDFEVTDALAKLERLGFLASKDGKLAAVPLGDALTRLDTLWDRLYDFSPKPHASVAA
ncbi:MAG: DUF3754 domain-containing protein [Alphaproteobacteria bacterium]|nr:DUF3754 domain-containing protein [Alphaproteobacteria bacterium]